MKITTVCKM